MARAYPPTPAPPPRQPSKTPLLGTYEVIGSGGDHTDESAAEDRGPHTAEPPTGGESSDDDGDDEDRDSPVADGAMTPLDAALEKIGMGRYQYQLLVLCGMGWAMDNMALQTVSVILPRVQEHFQVGDRLIGMLSTSIFAGMMIGAWGWGSFSDAKGRVYAFNLTLAITAVFATAAAFAPSFGWLCFALFWVGTGVGGSMPTDGTLFLENVPKTQHYLLTALSVFFSLGAIMASILSLIILPRFSCTTVATETTAACDSETSNVGWRYMLGAMAAVNGFLCVARVLLFRLHESPKFLVASNQPSAAVVSLRRISKANGHHEPRWALADVVDDHSSSSEEDPDANGTRMTKAAPGYEATGHTSPESRPRSSFASPYRPPSSPVNPALLEEGEMADLSLPASAMSAGDGEGDGPIRDGLSGKRSRTGWTRRLPPSWQEGMDAYGERFNELLAPDWRRTTMLVWIIWTLASAGYTIFNVFLPKFLESKLSDSEPDQTTTPEETLRDYVFYTLSGLPGSLVGAWLIETPLGRVKTLVFSTLATSAATVVFVFVGSPAGIVLSSMAVSFASTLMYAVIYGFTPEIFPVTMRGTASGIASALSRLAGIVAPLLTGVLLSLSSSSVMPLSLSAVCLLATAAAAWGLLGIEERMGISGGRRAGSAMVH
ncbi:hypothetical protein JCM8202_002100 [Rhodotorula sphaerocarpa]